MNVTNSTNEIHAKSQVQEERNKATRNLGPGLEVELELTSRGLHKSVDSAFRAANFYLFFIENDAGGDKSKIKEVSEGISEWRDAIERTIDKWDAATSGMKKALEEKKMKSTAKGELVNFECNSADAMLLVDLYRSADEALKNIRFLEILKQVDKDVAGEKKHEIRAEVGRQIRSISHLFRIAITRLSEAKKSDVESASKQKSENENLNLQNEIQNSENENLFAVEADD